MIARNEEPKKPDAPEEEPVDEAVKIAEEIMEEDKELLEKLDDNPKDTTKEWQELYEEVDKPKQEFNDEFGDMEELTKEAEPKKKEQESSEELKEEPSDVEQWNKWVQAAEKEVAQEQAVMFGDDNLKSKEIKERATLVAKYEDDAEWTKAKRKWKDDNPDQSIKDWKQAYVSGRIHELPLAPIENEQEGYVQNAEQSESSVWNKLQDSDNK